MVVARWPWPPAGKGLGSGGGTLGEAPSPRPSPACSADASAASALCLLQGWPPGDKTRKNLGFKLPLSRLSLTTTEKGTSSLLLSLAHVMLVRRGVRFRRLVWVTPHDRRVALGVQPLIFQICKVQFEPCLHILSFL